MYPKGVTGGVSLETTCVTDNHDDITSPNMEPDELSVWYSIIGSSDKSLVYN